MITLLQSRRLGVALLTALAVLGGCGGSDDPPAASTASSAPESTAATTAAPDATTTTTAAAFTPAAQWSATETSDTGDSVRIDLRLGRAQPPTENILLPSGRTSSDACNADPERDLVSVGDLTVTNLNTSLSQTVRARIFGGGGSGQRELFSASAEFRDPECVTIGVFSVTSTQLDLSLKVDGVAPGANVSLEFALVFPGARTPAFPDGDPATFTQKHLVLAANVDYASGFTQPIVQLTGPGIGDEDGPNSNSLRGLALDSLAP